MDPFDTKKTQAVWARVLAGRTPEPAPPERADPRLLMEQALRARRAYCALRTRAGRADQGCLEQLARAAGERARQLGAICFVQTGQMPCPPAMERPNVCSPARVLRQLYCQEREEAAQFSLLAQLQPEHAACYKALAEAAREHMNVVLRLLQRALPLPGNHGQI